MDLSRFFSFFNNRPQEEEISENLDTFKKTPLFKIGMFTKLIMNGMSFKKQVMAFFEKSSDDMDMDGVDLAGEFMMYHRSWYWISQADLTDEEWMNDLRRSSDDEFLTALKLSIHYFEENEEFEKCAFIKKIQDFVENYLEGVK